MPPSLEISKFFVFYLYCPPLPIRQPKRRHMGGLGAESQQPWHESLGSSQFLNVAYDEALGKHTCRADDPLAIVHAKLIRTLISHASAHSLAGVDNVLSLKQM